MKTKVIELYQFDELSEEAKETAINEYRAICENDSFDYLTGEAMATIKEGLKAFNCELSDWSIDFQNANNSNWKIHFSIDYLEEIQEFKPLRLRTYLVNNFYSNFFDRKPYGQYKKRETGAWKYDRYSKIQFVETSCPFTGMAYDESGIIEEIEANEREFSKEGELI